MSDIMTRLRELADLFEAGDAPLHVVLHMRAGADEIERLRANVARLTAMVTPKPLDGTEPRDRALIGVERPPFESETYYDIIHWREEQQEWMVEAGCDWSINPAPRMYAYWSVSHYLDPLELPGLPYWEGEDEEDRAHD